MSQITDLLNSPTFDQGVQRLKQGQVDRRTLAKELGVSPSTLSTTFRRAGLLEQLRDTKATGTSASSRANLKPSGIDPDKAKDYESALDLIRTGATAAEAHRRFPHLSYQGLAAKARQERTKATA